MKKKMSPPPSHPLSGSESRRRNHQPRASAPSVASCELVPAANTLDELLQLGAEGAHLVEDGVLDGLGPGLSLGEGKPVTNGVQDAENTAQAAGVASSQRRPLIRFVSMSFVQFFSLCIYVRTRNDDARS